MMDSMAICSKKGEMEPAVDRCDPDLGELDYLTENATRMTQGQGWVKMREFIGIPGPRDFKKDVVPLPPLNRREILVEGLCWTVENYMRDFEVKLGSIMLGEQLARVIASRHQDFPAGTIVTCASGWKTHSVIRPSVESVRTVKPSPDFPTSLYLGMFGMPGLTAYFGLLDLCCPQPGQIVLINAAAGPVGSIVGQLAKIRVGDEFMKGVLNHMKPNGRICVCGVNWCYARRVAADKNKDPYRLVFQHNKKVTVVPVNTFKSHFAEAQANLKDWYTQGRLRHREVIFHGFDQLPEALSRLSDSSRVGNVLVKKKSLAGTNASKMTSLSKTAEF